MNKYDEKLLSLLKEKNFFGFDASIEESLLCYGIVRRESDGFIILCNTFNPYSYGNTIIKIDEIKEAIEEIQKGFFEWLDISKEEYLNNFNLDVKHKNNLCEYIYDIRHYDDLLTYDIYYNLTAKEMINIMNHN